MAGMTRYSIDNNAREKAMRFVMVASFVLTIFINMVAVPYLEHLAIELHCSELFASFVVVGFASMSALSVFGLFWLLFDNYLWKCRPFDSMLGIPNLNGEWEGKGTTRFGDEDSNLATYSMSMIVTQTFSKIECRSIFEHSESSSQIVGICGCNPNEKSCSLEFSYLNKAGEKSVENDGWDEQHYGFNQIECRGDIMNGQYFTHRKNPTSGTFFLKRVK